MQGLVRPDRGLLDPGKAMADSHLAIYVPSCPAGAQPTQQNWLHFPKQPQRLRNPFDGTCVLSKHGTWLRWMSTRPLHMQLCRGMQCVKRSEHLPDPSAVSFAQCVRPHRAVPSRRLQLLLDEVGEVALPASIGQGPKPIDSRFY